MPAAFFFFFPADRCSTSSERRPEEEEEEEEVCKVCKNGTKTNVGFLGGGKKKKRRIISSSCNHVRHRSQETETFKFKLDTPHFIANFVDLGWYRELIPTPGVVVVVVGGWIVLICSAR